MGLSAKYKNPKFSYDYRFILLKKNLRLIWVVQTEIYSLDLMKMRSYFHSNPSRPSKIQRLGIVSSSSARFGRIERREAPWPRLGRAQARATVHKTRRGLIIHDLEDKGDSFCKLTMVEMDHGKLATGRRLGWPSKAVGTTSDDALAPRTSPAVEV
jgi:hypothetical protein